MVVGDLMDRSTVLPETVEYAAAVLGSFPGHVLIAPGPPTGSAMAAPMSSARGPQISTSGRTPRFEPAPAMPTMWGSAWTSPSSRAPRPADDGRDGGLRTLVRAGLSEGDLGRTRRRRSGRRASGRGGESAARRPGPGPRARRGRRVRRCSWTSRILGAGRSHRAAGPARLAGGPRRDRPGDPGGVRGSAQEPRAAATDPCCCVCQVSFRRRSCCPASAVPRSRPTSSRHELL